MIDSHIHILPGIDDGAADIDIALTMAKIAVDDGIHSLICTPHDLNSVYKNTRRSVLEHVKELQNYINESEIELNLYPGAELHLDADLVSKVLAGDAITLADKNKHVLIEFPKQFIPHGVNHLFETLVYNDLTPIIAHPERNPIFVRHAGLLEEYIEIGCKTQLTAMSVTGQFGQSIQNVCKKWCHQSAVHIVASDAHRPTGRAPILSLAQQELTQWLGEKAAHTLTDSNPNRILQGEELITITVDQPLQQQSKFRRSLFSIFWPNKNTTNARL